MKTTSKLAKRVLFWIAVPLSFFLTIGGFSLIARDGDILGKIIWGGFGLMIEVSMLVLVPDIRSSIRKAKSWKSWFPITGKMLIQGVFMLVSFNFSVGFALNTLTTQSLVAQATQARVTQAIDTSDIDSDIAEITRQIDTELALQSSLGASTASGYVTSSGNQANNSSNRITELRNRRDALRADRRAIIDAGAGISEELTQSVDSQQMFQLLGNFYNLSLVAGTMPVGIFVMLILMMLGAGALEIIKIISEEDTEDELVPLPEVKSAEIPEEAPQKRVRTRYSLLEVIEEAFSETVTGFEIKSARKVSYALNYPYVVVSKFYRLLSTKKGSRGKPLIEKQKNRYFSNYKKDDILVMLGFKEERIGRSKNQEAE